MVNVPKTRARTRKTFKKRIAVKTVRKAVKPSKMLTKAVKQVIYTEAETKHTPIDETEYAFTASSGVLQPSVNLANCLTMSQGTGDGNRIGNKIHVSKANLNLIVRRNDTASSISPCEVHLFIGYLKQERNTAPDAFYATSFYQDGGSVLPWNGTMIRTLRKVNKDLFIIVKKMVFKIAPSTATSVQFNNNDFPVLQRKIVSLKPLLGTITYGDDGTAGNFNKDLYMWGSYVYCNDTIDNLAVSPALKPIDVLYFVDLEYKDI